MSYFVPKDFLHHICENPSSETSQIAIALIMLIQSLKEQPHFDKAMFRNSIESALSHVENNQPILKEILRALA